MIVKGENRDTAWYSIIDSEWPALRKAYEDWLDPAISIVTEARSGGWRIFEVLGVKGYFVTSEVTSGG